MSKINAVKKQDGTGLAGDAGSETGTPRTDAKCADYSGPLSFVGGEQFLPANFARALERENFRLRVVLEEIARLDTSQLASAEQCCAVVLAMDALSFPNNRDVPTRKPGE